MSSNHSALPSVIGQDAYAGPDCDPDQKGQGQAGHTFSMALKQVAPTPPSLKTHMRLASQPLFRTMWIGRATPQVLGRVLSPCSHVIHLSFQRCRRSSGARSRDLLLSRFYSNSLARSFAP